MSKKINSRKLECTNSKSKGAKLVIANIVNNKKIIVDGDQEKTKKGVVVDNMLLNSHVNIEGNWINLNNIVKRSNKLKLKSKIPEKKPTHNILKMSNLIY